MRHEDEAARDRSLLEWLDGEPGHSRADVGATVEYFEIRPSLKWRRRRSFAADLIMPALLVQVESVELPLADAPANLKELVQAFLDQSPKAREAIKTVRDEAQAFMKRAISPRQ